MSGTVVPFPPQQPLESGSFEPVPPNGQPESGCGQLQPFGAEMVVEKTPGLPDQFARICERHQRASRFVEDVENLAWRCALCEVETTDRHAALRFAQIHSRLVLGH